MFSNFDEEARKVLINMKKEMINLRHPYIGSEHLFLSILKYGNKNIIEKLETYNLSYNKFKTELINIVGIGKKSSEFFLYTPLLKTVLENASIISREKNKDSVTCNDLFISLLEEGEGIAIRIMLGMNIDLESLYEEFLTTNNKQSKKNKLLIDNYGINLNEKAKNNEIDPVVGREKEVEKIIEILTRRTKNNPLLIGDAGVGKTAIVEEIARLIFLNKIRSLKNKKIISISMSNLVAGTKYRGEFEERLGKIIKELEKNPDIIVFIDEMHTLVGAGGAEGAIDASNILKPALARGKIKVIGATTTEEYKTFIEKDKALDRRFQTIEIKEPSLDVVKNILIKLTPIYEGYHKVKINDNIISLIVELSNKYIYDRKMPDKAIDILDEVCSKVANGTDKNEFLVDEINNKINIVRNLKNEAIINNKFNDAFMYKKQEKELESEKNRIEIKTLNRNVYKNVTIKDVKIVIEEKSKIPVFDDYNNNNLKNLKKNLNNVIIGQEEVIDKMYNITKKIRYGLKNNSKPYSFLFIGKSGVGKTLLAKEYAKQIYGIDNFIRLDMSEYKESHSISKIIGSPPGYVGYSDNKNIFEEIRDKPYSVILLDEIEKANKNVINLFLQILDEGKAKNSKGNVIRFDNTVIIMTSNLGSNYKEIGFNFNKLNNDNELMDFFGNSFLNRINEIIYFKDIDENAITKIINKNISKLRDIYKLKDIHFSINKNVIEEIKKLCKYNKYGARKVEKIINSYLETIIIDRIIIGEKEIKINNINMEVV